MFDVLFWSNFCEWSPQILNCSVHNVHRNDSELICHELIPLLVEINLSKIVTGIKSQIAFTFTATKLSLWAEEPDISN